MVGLWVMSYALDQPFECRTRKQDGNHLSGIQMVGLSGIQMVGLSGIQMAFENQAFGIQPVFNHLNTRLVWLIFRSPLYTETILQKGSK